MPRSRGASMGACELLTSVAKQGQECKPLLFGRMGELTAITVLVRPLRAGEDRAALAEKLRSSLSADEMPVPQTVSSVIAQAGGNPETGVGGGGA